MLAAVAARERGRAVAVLLLRDLVALARVRVAARALVWVTRLLLVALVAVADYFVTRRADADALVHPLCALATLAAHALCYSLVATATETHRADTVGSRAPAGVAVATVRGGRHAEALCDELAAVTRHVLVRHWLDVVSRGRHLGKKGGSS